MTSPSIPPFTGQLPDDDDPVTFEDRAIGCWSWLVEAVPAVDSAGQYIDGALQESATLVDAVAALQARMTAAEEALKIKVGGLYLSTSGTDPATSLGYGTWEAFGQGRALVGAGNGVTAGAGFGADSRTLTVSQLPSHQHWVSLSGTTGGAGGHNHGIMERAGDIGNAVSGHQSWVTGGDTEGAETYVNTVPIQSVGDHAHSVALAGASDAQGGGAAVDMRQASIGVYVWRRTA